MKMFIVSIRIKRQGGMDWLEIGRFCLNVLNSAELNIYEKKVVKYVAQQMPNLFVQAQF